MRQKTGMCTATVVAPGPSQIIQNIIRLRHNILQLSLPQTSPHHHRHLQRNHPLQKARVAVHIINQAADQRLPAKCQVLPVTGQEVVPAQAPGVVVAEPVVAEAVAEDGVVAEAEVVLEVAAVAAVVVAVEEDRPISEAYSFLELFPGKRFLITVIWPR
jgi:hypothetical protein